MRVTCLKKRFATNLWLISANKGALHVRVVLCTISRAAHMTYVSMCGRTDGGRRGRDDSPQIFTIAPHVAAASREGREPSASYDIQSVA